MISLSVSAVHSMTFGTFFLSAAFGLIRLLRPAGAGLTRGFDAMGATDCACTNYGGLIAFKSIDYSSYTVGVGALPALSSYSGTVFFFASSVCGVS